MSNILTNNINPRSGNVINIGGVNDTVSIAGTVTYEDVTSVDSIGIITGRNGLHVTSGNVGIGTDNPTYQLQVFNDNIPASLRLQYGSNTGFDVQQMIDGSAQVWNVDNTDLKFATNDQQRLLITSAGQVSLMNGGSQYGFIKESGSGNLELGGTTDLILSTDSLEKLRISSSGNIGIGTATVGDKLVIAHVDDEGLTFKATGTDGTTATQITYEDTNGGIGGILQFDHDNNSFSFETAGNERARIDSSGRLLVGTSSGSGSGLLIVQGGAGSSGADAVVTLRRGNTNPASGLQGLGVINFEDLSGGWGASIAAVSDGSWNTPSDCPTYLKFSTTADGASSPTERMRIRQDGAVLWFNLPFIAPSTDNAVAAGGSSNRFSAIWAANGTIQTSDQRAKTDIAGATLGSEFIKSLRPVSYKWVEGGKVDTGERDEDGNCIYEPVPGTRTHWGFIAQEVKQAVDAAGVDFGGWVLTDKDDPSSGQALRYDQFIAPLTKALQEAIAKIETLEAKVQTLEGGAS